jgi:hypothetical protein
MPNLNDIPYAVIQRLRLIEIMLTYCDSLNRSALVDYFGISTVQASVDFSLYRHLAPKNMRYDGSAKTYRRVNFQRIWN